MTSVPKVKDRGAPVVLEDLTEEECYLYAILQDHSGLDQAEFLWWDGSSPDGCWRAWEFQVPWWRDRAPQQIDLAGRSVGKSLSVKARMCAFPLRVFGQEAAITAPELIHLEPIINLIEEQLLSTRLLRELLPKGRSAITHRPFMCNFVTGSRILGRIPQRDGRGVKGIHPIQLEQDECFPAGTLVLTRRRGLVAIEAVEVGEEVLTHRLRWRRVTATWDRGELPAVTVRGQGHPGLLCTANHKFWSRKITGWRDTKNRWGVRRTTDLGWHTADELEDCLWSSPTEFPPTGPWEHLQKSQTGTSAPIATDTVEFAWALGLFLAEGSLSSGNGGPLNRVYWSIHVDEVNEVERRLEKLGLPVMTVPTQSSDLCVSMLVHHRALADWLAVHVGRGATNKQIPVDVFGRDEDFRRAVLEGLVYGDGFEDPDDRYEPGRWKLTTASRRLAVGARLLALSLGYHVSVYWNESRSSTIRGREVCGNGWYQVVGNVEGQGRPADGLMLTRVRSVTPAPAQRMYDLSVAEDESFCADGILVHNSQDYPEAGWTELNETVKNEFEGAEWRAHGVTRGVRGTFYERTQETPDSQWRVHKITAMHRPGWNEAERQRSIAKYGGSRDDPDYRRNVYGQHGDPTSALFVMDRLVKCIDDDKTSDYNTLEYKHLEISDATISQFRRDGGTDVTELLEFPVAHRDYAVTWCGMDVGLTVDPSEILIFAEYEPDETEREEMTRDAEGRPRKKACPARGVTRLKLLTRVSLKRVLNPDQVAIILGVIDYYKPVAFALDRTGIGFPLFQDLQNMFRDAEELAESLKDPEDRQKYAERAQMLRDARDRIKGYNFSEKVAVEIDDEVEIDEYADEPLKDAVMEQQVLEYSTTLCRRLVDSERLWLPWDRTLIAEYEGQTVSYSKSPIDQFGKRRRIFAEGKFHAFDASRMFAMAHGQQKIEELLDQDHGPEETYVIVG